MDPVRDERQGSDLSASPKPVVVCVDDEPQILRALERALRSEPYEVWTTDEPAEALEWIRTGRVSVLVADQRMPGMKGTELLQAAQEESPATARILLTAYPGDPLVLRGLGRSVLCMIGKPWDDASLRRTIAELLERP